MKRVFFPLAACLLVVFMLVTIRPVQAHGHTEVGDYEIEIGFHNEPAYLGQPNGLDLFVTHHTSGEGVNGLEETLRAEIIFGSSKKELAIEPQEGDGAYTAAVVPTQVGDYTWHIFGTIEGTPVDISMTSSPDTFGSVEPLSDYEFPGGQADLQAQVEAAAAASRTATAAGIAGVVLGALGLVVGALGWQTARRKM
jgi:hypothetical protein